MSDDIQQVLEKAYAGRLERVQDYIVVPTSLFVPKIDVKMPPLPNVDFFEERDGAIHTIRRADQPYSPLALRAREHVLVHIKEFAAIRDHAESQILSSTIDPTQKAERLRRTAMYVVEDIFTDPSPENIRRGKKIVGALVYVLMNEPGMHTILSRLSSHDPYTLQHSVGCSVNSIILARKVGITAKDELNDIGLGGLLHDVGKIKVDVGIINKVGGLEDDEWEKMKEHPIYGYEILKDNSEIPMRTKLAVLEHHEDHAGTGYPNGKLLRDLGLPTKIVAISDIFNALTTDRSYSKARSPFEAFQLIKEKLGHKVDDVLFKQMVAIYGGKYD